MKPAPERALLTSRRRSSCASSHRRGRGSSGAGRERRRRRHRRRPRRRLQDGIPQPPVVHRAVPGRGDGVGGILRDVFNDGARPIAVLDPLFFGDPKAPRMHGLIDGVVRGVGGYGNCIGIPTVGGSTFFHPSYDAGTSSSTSWRSASSATNGFSRRRPRGRQPGPLRRLEDRTRRHPRRLDGVRRLRRRERPSAARRSRWATRSPRSSSSRRSSRSSKGRRRRDRSRTWGPRGSPHLVRDVRARRRRDAPRPRPGADAPRVGDEPLRALMCSPSRRSGCSS